MVKRQSGWRVAVWTSVIALLFLYLTSFFGLDAWLAKAY